MRVSLSRKRHCQLHNQRMLINSLFRESYSVNIIYREAPINLLVEGLTDEVVAKRLLTHVGLLPGKSFGKSGKANLLARLPNYNQAARHSIWFAMIDLDSDAVCASQAIVR